MKKSGLLTNQTRTTPTFITHFYSGIRSFYQNFWIDVLFRKKCMMDTKLSKYKEQNWQSENSLQTVRDRKLPYPWMRTNFQIYSRTQTPFSLPKTANTSTDMYKYFYWTSRLISPAPCGCRGLRCSTCTRSGKRSTPRSRRIAVSSDDSSS